MDDELIAINEPITNNEPITKDQLQILNDAITFYNKDESTIECCEITMYCHINSIDIVDELAIYNYLYGVQENICFHKKRKSPTTPKSSKRRMSEFSNSILNIENMLYEPSTSTDDELSQPPLSPPQNPINSPPSNLQLNNLRHRLPSF
jgi:hypothetical protein